MSMLDLTRISKSFAGHVAVDDVSLQIGDGEIVGLLGPNGAGKTTLMKLILGLQRADHGALRFDGSPMTRQSRTQIGALVEGPGLWPRMTARQHLHLHAQLRCVPDADAAAEGALATLGLSGVADRPVAKQSLGMRWRTGIAIALVARPKLLLLDEPTNGLDPYGVRDMRDTLLHIAEQGTSVLVSSHQLHEMTRIARRVVVMSAGRVRYDGRTDGLARDGDLESGFLDLLSGDLSQVR